MFERIAELTIRRSKPVLVVAALLVVLMGAVGAGAFGKLAGGGFDDPAAESTRAGQVIDEKFGGETNLVLLARAAEGRIDDPAAQRSGRELVAALKQEPGLTNVVSYWDTQNPALRSEDGREAMVLLHVKGDEKEQQEAVEKLVDTHAGSRDDGLTVRAGGAAAVSSDLSTQVGKDLLLAEAIAVPLTLLLLLVVFGSVVAALLPLLIGVVAVAGTFAVLAVLGGVTDVSTFAVNLTTALGLGLGSA